MKRIALLLTAVCLCFGGFAQQKQDKSIFKEYQPGYYQNSIMKDIRMVDEKLEKKDVDKRFFMDQSSYDLPNKISLYKDNTQWAQGTISQGNAGTCWCFSTTSYYESEVYRLHQRQVKISEMYTVYWEYVEKARRFIQERGNSLFDEGSEGNAVARIWKQYGTCPESEYSGLINGRKFYTHAKMYKEMMAYLNSVKKNNAWNEDEALATIKAIMNHYMGTPPTKFRVEGKEYNPQSYLSDYLKLNMDDYVEILSYKQEPYWKQVEYKVPDNWWHSKEYYNIPLDDFMKVVKTAVRKGYTMSIGGDVSEAGFLRTTNCAMVPTFDIPSEYINENARQMRFSNGSTTDDHGMHLIGYYVDKNGKDWYLIKDSSSGSRNIDENSPEFGYYFFQEDYVKLKMMGFTIHKDAVKDLLKKFK
ncbi:peptidase C1 [Ancylomarina longa]|uniref:Peptidase C1 n=1 Tax=Ancylomarina longa TaxID=2487017 RepID=A0A434AYZ5_9BACT|nr:peptidase C1 [Ancylomarina longa]RUT79627.1 peptidase C1 [Ancylomarina longa]